MRIRRLAAALAAPAVIIALTAAVPAAASTAQAAQAQPAGQGPPQVAHHYPKFLRKGPLPNSVVTNIWSGYIDNTINGKTMQAITGSVSVPQISCSDTKIGTSGDAVTDYWVGISSGPPNSALTQLGLESYCLGTSGHFGSGSGNTFAWYYECCTSPSKPLGVFSLPSGVIYPSANLTFHTVWLPNATNCGQTGCYQFVIYYLDSNNVQQHQTKYLPCYTGVVCGQSTSAESITEVPGCATDCGATPNIEWSPTAQGCLPCIAYPSIQFDTTLVQSNDASGNLFSKAGEWNLSTVLQAALSPLPQVTQGDTTDGLGAPGTLSADGSGGTQYLQRCGVEKTDQSFHDCLYNNY